MKNADIVMIGWMFGAGGMFFAMRVAEAFGPVQTVLYAGLAGVVSTAAAMAIAERLRGAR